MRFPATITPEAICSKFGAVCIGNADLAIEGLNEIHVVQPGEITFVVKSNLKFIILQTIRLRENLESLDLKMQIYDINNIPRYEKVTMFICNLFSLNDLRFESCINTFL